jgi:hypothetical protein
VEGRDVSKNCKKEEAGRQTREGKYNGCRKPENYERKSRRLGSPQGKTGNQNLLFIDIGSIPSRK